MKVRINWTRCWWSRHEAYGWQVRFIGPIVILWNYKERA